VVFTQIIIKRDYLKYMKWRFADLKNRRPDPPVVLTIGPSLPPPPTHTRLGLTPS
jgi:hypothetical protein